jgi:excisionase family DNA binding protein
MQESREPKDKRGEYLTAGQLAKMLQISESSVHRLRRQGRIPAVMLTPRLIRFNLRDVRAALAAAKDEGEPVLASQPDSRQLTFEDLFTRTIE